MNSTIMNPLATILIAAAASSTAVAQTTVGADEFQERCAACHGLEGQGDGIVANLFAEPPKNLTQIAQRNGGVFPFQDVYAAVDGTREIAGHGSSQMPLWGRYFTDKVRREGIQDPTPLEDQESKLVQGRILSLVYFLQSIQVE